MPHRSLHNGVRCDPTQASTEDVPQIVDGKVRYACSSKGGLPCGLDRRDWLVVSMRTREDKRTLVGLFLVPRLQNIASEFGKGNRFGRAWLARRSAEDAYRRTRRGERGFRGRIRKSQSIQSRIQALLRKATDPRCPVFARKRVNRRHFSSRVCRGRAHLGPTAKVRILRFKNLSPFRQYRGPQNYV